MNHQQTNNNGKRVIELLNKVNNVHKRLDGIEEKINKIGMHCESIDNRLPERQKGYLWDGWSTQKQDALKTLGK